MTQFSSQCTNRKNWVILTKIVESLAEVLFDPTFLVKITQFFSQCTKRKKLSHFDLKSWVTGGIIIGPVKVSNWRIFKSIGLLMLSQFDFQCRVNLTLNVESIWLSMLNQLDSQCWANLNLNVEQIRLSMLSQFHYQCWVNLAINVESIWLSMLSQFDLNVESIWLKCWVNLTQIFISYPLSPVEF